MAWIKVDQKLVDHQKTFRLAELLDLEEVQVIGYLVALWAWALDHHPAGVLPNNDRMIARQCRWSGPPEHFVRSLVESGFVDDDYMGKMEIHAWEEYAGPLLRRRELERKRIQEKRSPSKP